MEVVEGKWKGLRGKRWTASAEEETVKGHGDEFPRRNKKRRKKEDEGVQERREEGGACDGQS